MTVRSPEVHWPMALPMMILMGFNLHVPLVLQSLSLLPDWANVNKDVAITDFVYRLWLQHCRK